MSAYHSNFGPRGGPILQRDDPPAMGVYATSEPGQVAIGIAYPVGHVETRKGVAKTFRLVIDKEEVEGRWICVGRVFVRLGEAAEDV